MFSKKYVFETKYTRSRRTIINLILMSGFLLFSIFLLCIYIPRYAKNNKEKTELAFYQKAPDVIAVFTGDKGRIDYAFKMAEKYPSVKIFITGVYAKNSLTTLLKKQGKNISVEEFLTQESHHIELDYLARNTVENGIATINYLKRIKKAKNVVIVSSDYHILRISLIMNTLTDDYNFYYDSISGDYSNTRDLKILFKEVFKLLKTSTFLLFWDKETPTSVTH